MRWRTSHLRRYMLVTWSWIIGIVAAIGVICTRIRVGISLLMVTRIGRAVDMAIYIRLRVMMLTFCGHCSRRAWRAHLALERSVLWVSVHAWLRSIAVLRGRGIGRVWLLIVALLSLVWHSATGRCSRWRGGHRSSIITQAGVDGQGLRACNIVRQILTIPVV
jgi:hypothetical protein